MDLQCDFLLLVMYPTTIPNNKLSFLDINISTLNIKTFYVYIKFANGNILYYMYSLTVFTGTCIFRLHAASKFHLNIRSMVQDGSKHKSCTGRYDTMLNL